ncbi:DNA alkylation repair protein [Maliponia aquimaris]|uniref:DNA alkylation repair enzyme n=1 Tax=Maliponia aquimaris TaxID=1673631 RepID=A0A238K189_9RHOB|nr:DNA alkylation repair protein [Maliponia aquimaris]SMX36678.1 DNA alkylation repair enzyme [Maliponia aquimaris]
MTVDEALDLLRAAGDVRRAAGSAAYHKAARVYLGVPNPVLNDFARDWRPGMDLEARIALADGLWRSDIHEARILAAKLLTQARIRPDDAPVWRLICSWAPEFDGWAVADHACMAGQRRVMADLSRLDEVEGWTRSDHMWTRRAALVITLPLAKLTFPKPEEVAARDRVLGWAAGYVPDRDWFIQKAVAWWIRDLSKHDAPAARDFLVSHGAGLKAFARKEAGKYLRG